MIYTISKTILDVHKYAFTGVLVKPFRIWKLQYSERAVDVNTKVAKDVILYKYDNPKFYKYLNIFAICQFGFWNYLSVFALQTLRDAPVSPSENAAWWEKINLGENKYRNTLSVLAFTIGWGILTVSWMFTLRTVRYLVLHKGGEKATIVTYGPFGKNRMFTLDLNNINCKGSRQTTSSTLPLKVKGHYLHYMVDSRGEFRNPSLFDHTVGLKR
ncbi:transmembrane protein 223 isoform X2 [Agrilus planipennis]|nr:transmembrane protein 223 isoform X2 [Agrilus planipennis]